jgi:hypothetical protein
MAARWTHKNPLKNLHTTSIPKLVARLDSSVETNDRMSVGTMTDLRPLRSATKPQTCELVMMPMLVMPESTPLCCVVSARSHSATGNTKLMPERHVSRRFSLHQLSAQLTERLERRRRDDDPSHDDDDVIKRPETLNESVEPARKCLLEADNYQDEKAPRRNPRRSRSSRAVFAWLLRLLTSGMNGENCALSTRAKRNLVHTRVSCDFRHRQAARKVFFLLLLRFLARHKRLTPSFRLRNSSTRPQRCLQTETRPMLSSRYSESTSHRARRLYNFKIIVHKKAVIDTFHKHFECLT